MGGGVQGGCEWRSEAFFFLFFFGGGVGLRGGGGQGGCELRSEAFAKIQQKKIRGGGSGWGRRVGGGGFRVDVNGEVKLL